MSILTNLVITALIKNWKIIGWAGIMVKVALFANGLVGLEVTRFLVKNNEKIVKLYLHDPNNQRYAKEIIKSSKCSDENIILASNIYKEKNIEKLKNANPDFIITVYWSHILKPILFNIAKIGSINFHPALLPINRGWYPHVHSIVTGNPFGVTLHCLEEKPDAGPIWVQKEVFMQETDTAFEIYLKLQKEIIKLFKNNWSKIKNGLIKPYKQDETKAIYHRKNEIDNLDYIDINKSYKARELINILRARSYGKKGFAYYENDKGEKIYLNLSLNKKIDF